MQNLFAVVKPNLNDCVVLPKDFKKQKPDAKRADYPILTGYTALHFGKCHMLLYLIDICVH